MLQNTPPQWLSYPCVFMWISFSIEHCPGASPVFTGKEGMFIEGQITPPFASVSVTITTNATDKYEGSVVEILTDEHGKYRYGLYGDPF